MANLGAVQRAQMERIELSVPTTGIRVGRTRPITVYLALATALAGVLLYATIDSIDGWAHLVVIAAAVATTVGVMIAINPRRRG